MKIAIVKLSSLGDIVLSMVALQFIKKTYPNKPIILLVFDESELKLLPKNYSNTIDNVFIWSGNAGVFPAIMKYIEDKENVARDTAQADVRSIIIVEDTPRYYSSILPILYKIILYHTQQLISNSLNDSQKLLHLRKRPKILLAQTYEEAVNYFNEYQNNILGIISDIRFPKDNKKDKRAGIKFSEYVHSKDEAIPIILQTTDMEVADDEQPSHGEH